MAIPFYQYNEKEESEVIGDKVVRVQEQANNASEESIEEVRDTMEVNPEQDSFVGRLIQELVGVYLRLSSGRRRVGMRNRRLRNGDRPTSSQQTTPTPLPDLISSNTPITRPSGSNSIPQNQSTSAIRDSNLHPRTLSLPPNENFEPQNNPRLPETGDDLTLRELGLHIKSNFSYRSIGQDLRRIAGQFELENSTHSRSRRRLAWNHYGENGENTKISLKFELAFKLVIPATLLGLSLALFKKSP